MEQIMESYKFGGSKITKFKSKLISSFNKYVICSTYKVLLWTVRKLHTMYIKISSYSAFLLKKSAPLTIHINRIVPIDKFIIRIEFTVDRKSKYCIHLESLDGSYSKQFADFKRGEVIEPIEAHYFIISSQRKKWKRLN